MDLFTDNLKVESNLLPFDGMVNYYGKIISKEEAAYFFKTLMENIEWKNDEAFIFGKHFITKRKVAWYGDSEYSYTYSNKTKLALPWTRELLQLKGKIEHISGAQYNSCLLNLYHSGEEGMAWHSDDEKELAKNSTIASLSLGAERRFTFKNKSTKEIVPVFLEEGSLLLMKGSTQLNWWHRLAPTKKVKTPRVNLTFRKMNN